MALIKCKECGKEVSKKTKVCPACGSPAKKKTSIFTWLVVVIIGVVVYTQMQPEERPPAPVVMTAEQKLARVAVLVEELKTIPAGDVRDNLERYQELVQLQPDNSTFAGKVALYDSRLVRLKKIEMQFSGWSGAHQPLEKYIKKNLKDPDSYDHVESRYVDEGDSVLVQLTYRARNGFGGMAVETARARCTIEGACTVL